MILGLKMALGRYFLLGERRSVLSEEQSKAVEEFFYTLTGTRVKKQGSRFS